MSAYALPGLFPPIDSYNPSTKLSESSQGPIALSPLHHQIDGSRLSGIFSASLDLLSVPSFTSSGNGSSKKEGERPEAHTKPIHESDSEERRIAVKEAKIDPVRLVQSVTRWPRAHHHNHHQYQQQSKSSRRRLPRERNLDSSAQSLRDDSDQHPSSCVNVGAPHDEAIEFELSISFSGRKYTATRTLQRIVQLRDDLIREMNIRRRWLRIRRDEAAASLKAPSSCASTDEEGASDVSGRADEDDNENICIPEIPSFTGGTGNGSAGTGFVGRGFTMLHAMATSYVPIVDRWLRNILAIVPQDSECLTNFLWEPLSNEHGFPLPVSSKSCASLATLGSIKELDYNTDTEDDDDDDVQDDTW